LTKDFSRIRLVRGRRFLFQVETSDRAEDYRKYEDLRRAIWGCPDDSLPGTRNMLCENFLQDGSSLFLAVYAADDRGRLVADAGRCVGFSYGFAGLKDKSLAFTSLDNLWFYSQYTGVRADYRSYGLGVLIKEYQRDILLEVLGLATVVCTFDPLTGVNARRNIHHFGMEVVDYRPAVYGEFGGLLNRRDVPSDRFFVSWDLRKKPGRPALRGEAEPAGALRPFPLEWRDVRGRSGRLKLEVLGQADLSARGDTLLIPIPEDFYTMLGETDVDDSEVRRIPLDWRLKTREAFQVLLRAGYTVSDFRRLESGNFYILTKLSGKT